MFELSAIQIVIVLVIALMVFGPKRLPELSRQIGRGLRELKGHMHAVSEGVSQMTAEPPDPPPPAAAVPPPAHPADDDDLLDGVVVSGGTPPQPPRPTGSP